MYLSVYGFIILYKKVGAIKAKVFYHIYYIDGHDNNYTYVASQKHDIIELELQGEVTLCS